uniref:Uncharacterized protein n=1 Tax=Leersia perrieri TaxID=77586 RepID=A0A0D9W7Q6_9ORYZ
MKLNLTTGLVPTLNVSAALIAFVVLRCWTQALGRLGIASRPFTRQENTVVQTCAVACYSIARTYEMAGEDTEGNVPGSYKEPGIAWMTGFLLAVSFVGLLALVPLRKVMIIDYKLTYPSGTATAVLINGFHTPHGDAMAKQQVNGFTKYFAMSFFWSFFQWFYSGGDNCGFSQFPTFGLKAWQQTFFFDFSLTYVGAGMICSHLVNLSLLLGAFLSWGVMWPLISDLKGNCRHTRKQHEKPARIQGEDILVLDELHRNEVFARDNIPSWLAYTGLTDINMAYNYGKVALFILAAWAGKDSGVVAGLVGCGLVKSLVSISADLMHDFKTGHLTLTSPRSMIIAQAIGTVMGCIISPLTFLLFYNAFDIGNPEGYWKAPYALVYRNMAILGVEGFSALPQHCLQLCYGFFGFAVAANLMRDLCPAKYSRWVPLPMAMGVPFLVGASFAIDMCIGSLIVFTWHMIDKNKAALMVPAVASGLICGDGLWIFPASLLALAKISPPMCMAFRSTH